jgi:hypothetical protein
MSGRTDHPVSTDRRGRAHRPAVLEVCLACGELRAPFEGFDNLCECDRDVWDETPLPRAGDLSSNVDVGQSCISVLAPGSSRWRLYHCRDCMRAVACLNRLAGRCVVPIGPHSIMNGVFAAASPPPTESQVVSFADQLGALFRHQERLHDRTKRRVRQRLAEFGVTGDAMAASEYLERSAAEGWTAERGFVDFVQSLDGSLDEAAACELWCCSLE